MDLKNKIVSVIGLGKTGIATANFLSLQGARVSIMDNNKKTGSSLMIKIKNQNCILFF